MKKKIATVLACLATAALMLSACGSPSGSSSEVPSAPASSGQASPSSAAASDGVVPTEVTIYGGTTGGSWNIATQIIGNFLPQDISGIRCTVSPGAAYSNVQGVQDGSIILGISKLPTTVDGYNAVKPFTKKCDKVMNMGFLYTEHYHIIVPADSKVQSVADLKGKRLTTFAVGNTAEVIARDLLSTYGMTYKDMSNVSYSSLSDMAEQFKDGQTDCLMFASALPVSEVMDICSVRKIRLIDVPDDKLEAMQKISPAFQRVTIPAGTYQGVDQKCETLGCAQHMIVSSDLSADFVYAMTKSIVTHLDKLGAGHVVYAQLTPELMAQDLGIPMHPGAEKYYKEIGAMS